MRKILWGLLGLLGLAASESSWADGFVSGLAAVSSVAATDTFVDCATNSCAGGVAIQKATALQIGTYISGGTWTWSGVDNFTGTLQVGGNALTMSAALTTTGAGAATLAFPASPFTFTFPSASKTLMAADHSNAAGWPTTGDLLLSPASGAPTAFAGSNCPGSQFASSIAATGALTCSVPAGGGNVSTSGTITTATLGVWNGSTTQTGTGTFSGNETYSGISNFTGTFEVGGAVMTFPATAKTLLATDGSNAGAGFLAAAVPVATGCGGTTNFVRADGTCVPPAGGTPVIFVGPATNGGSGNAYTIATPTPSSPPFAITNQYVVRASIDATNTASATLNVNSTGAKPIVANTQSGLSTLVGGELQAGLEYDFAVSTSSATACASACYVLTNVAQSAITTGGQTITVAQWAAGTVLNITTAAQTITLPPSTTLTPNGGLFVNTIANSVILAVNGSDAVNGGAPGASFVIPANTLVQITTPAANAINVTPGMTGVTAGAYTSPTITVDSFGRITAAVNATVINKPLAIGWVAGANPDKASLGKLDHAVTIQAIFGMPEVLLGVAGTVDVYDQPTGSACTSSLTKITTTAFDSNTAAGTEQNLLSAPYSLLANHWLCLVVSSGTFSGGNSVATITAEYTP